MYRYHRYHTVTHRQNTHYSVSHRHHKYQTEITQLHRHHRYTVTNKHNYTQKYHKYHTETAQYVDTTDTQLHNYATNTWRPQTPQSHIKTHMQIHKLHSDISLQTSQISHKIKWLHTGRYIFLTLTCYTRDARKIIQKPHNYTDTQLHTWASQITHKIYSVLLLRTYCYRDPTINTQSYTPTVPHITSTQALQTDTQLHSTPYKHTP